MARAGDFFITFETLVLGLLGCIVAFAYFFRKPPKRCEVTYELFTW